MRKQLASYAIKLAHWALANPDDLKALVKAILAAKKRAA
jgi:hypothetical protein